MTIDISNVISISLGAIAVLISGKLAYNQWRAAINAKFFRNGAYQAIKAIMAKAQLGQEFEIGDDQTGQKVILIKVNKKPDKKESKNKNAKSISTRG